MVRAGSRALIHLPHDEPPRLTRKRVRQLAAMQAGVDRKRLSRLATLFVACRVLYVIMYASSTGRLAVLFSSCRSLVWMAGMMTATTMYRLAMEEDEKNCGDRGGPHVR